MRKILAAGMAALTLGGSMAATATPAAAQTHGHGGFHGGNGGWHGGNGWHGGGWRGGRRDNDAGAAIAGGIVGLALGSAIASNHYYGRGYYDGGYYDGPYYGYDDGYAVCTSHRRVWDPYVGRWIVQRFHYAC